MDLDIYKNVKQDREVGDLVQIILIEEVTMMSEEEKQQLTCTTVETSSRLQFHGLGL